MSVSIKISLKSGISDTKIGPKKEVDYAFTAGVMSSSFESVIWEQLTGYNVISTISILQEAGNQGIDTLVLTEENYASMSGKLEVSETVEKDVHNAVPKKDRI